MRRIDTRSFVRATRSTSRDINRRIILNLVREHEPISRAEIARRMGIGRGMVTSLVSELLTEGAIYQGETARAPRGRHPEMLFVRSRDRLVVAVDVRLSRTYLMLCDFAGTQLAFDSMPTRSKPGQLASDLSRRITRMLETSGDGKSCEGIGLVVPGMIDRATGHVVNSPQLGWHAVNIRDLLSAEVGLPVQIENAPIACALARMWSSSSDRKAPQSFVYVTVSDGVGTALVVRGEVVRGAGGTAGEFGHVPISIDGPECLCGATGCLEAYTSNLATISRYLGRKFSPATVRALVEESGVTIEDVIARAGKGERKAVDALSETARYLATGIAGIINAVNPATVFVGGEITDAWELFEPAIRDEISRRALSPQAAATPVIPEPAGSHPRLEGATALLTALRFAAPVVA
jgi:N-acetylglucosamine repressor